MANRTVIGSETSDDRKITLDSLNSGAKYAVPVTVYDSTGTIVNGNSPVSLSASAPSSATVETTSTQVLAVNSLRKGAVFVNISTSTISFGIGTTAVLNKGITLKPNGTWVMDQFTYTTAVINAISTASANLSIQEFS